MKYIIEGKEMHLKNNPDVIVEIGSIVKIKMASFSTLPELIVGKIIGMKTTRFSLDCSRELKAIVREVPFNEICSIKVIEQ